MVDFEETFNDIGSDVGNIVKGDIEIGGKKIPKIAIIGIGGLGIAAIVIINRNRVSGVISGSSNDAIASPIGNTNPSATNDNNSDAGGFSPLGNLESVLSNIPGIGSDATPISDFEGSLPSSFISNGDLSQVSNFIPDLSSYTNPALDYLPDLSSFGLAAIPSVVESGFRNVSEPYSSMPTNINIAAKKEANKPVTSKVTSSLLSGFNAFKPTTKPTKKVSGNAIVKSPAQLNLFGGSVSPAKPQTKPTNSGNAIVKSISNLNLFGFSVKPTTQPVVTKPVNSGNAIVSSPIKSIINLWGNSQPKPVTPSQPYKPPVIISNNNPITSFLQPKPVVKAPVSSGNGRTTIRSAFQW